MATFVFKVFTLAIRTAAKPLASRFQSYVLDHPTLRPRVLKFAQGIHAVDFAMTRFAEGKSITGSQKFLGTLDDERALDVAGKFVSEGFILAVGIGVIYWDYRRGAEKDALKSERDKAYKISIEDRFSQIEKSERERLDRHDAILQAIQERQNSTDLLLKSIQESRKRWLFF